MPPTRSPWGDKKRVCVVVIACLFLAAAPANGSPPPVSDGTEVSFIRDVAPILATSCLACHDEQEANGSFQVTSYARLLKSGDSGETTIEPGQPAASHLYRLITSEDVDERMPRDADPLPAEALDRIRRWIEAGARYDGDDPETRITSLLPRERHPAAPVVYPRPIPITAAALVPSANEILVGGYHEVTVWDAAAGAIRRRIGDIPQRVLGIAVAPDASAVVVVGGTPGVSGEAAVFNLAGERLRSLYTTTDVVLCVRLNPGGDLVAIGSADRSIRVYDVSSGMERLKIDDHADWVTGVAWSPDGRSIASASRDKTSKLFDAATGASLATYPGYGEPLYAVAFSADGKQVFVAGRGGRVHGWKIEDGNRAVEFGGFGQEVYALRIEGEELLACSTDGTVRSVRLSDQQEARRWEGLGEWVYCFDSLPAEDRLVAGGYDGRVMIWHRATSEAVGSFLAAPGIQSAAVLGTARPD